MFVVDEVGATGAVVVAGTTTGAEVGVVAGVEAGFAAAAVFAKQAQALDILAASMLARFWGAC